MNSQLKSQSSFISPSKQAIGNYLGPLSRIGRHIFFSKIKNVTRGGLIIHENGHQWQFGTTSNGDLHHLYVHNPQFYSNVVLGGSLGAAESYVLREWSMDNLIRLLRFFLQNADALQSLDSGLGKILAPFHKICHRLRINSLRGSRLNIAAHYDFGNDFFAKFLDSTMMYSSAYFERDDMTLEEASNSKINIICRKLELAASDNLVEIGCGWGGLCRIRR